MMNERLLFIPVEQHCKRGDLSDWIAKVLFCKVMSSDVSHLLHEAVSSSIVWFSQSEACKDQTVWRAEYIAKQIGGDNETSMW